MNFINKNKCVYPNFTANIMPKNCAEYINNNLKSAKTVDIFCHTMSDEDTFNSAKAMYSYLESLGISSRIITSKENKNYDYDTKKYNIISESEINEKTKKSDIALCVDFSSNQRVKPNVLNYIKSYGKNIVGFDHHNEKSNLITKDVNIITESYSKIKDMPALNEKKYYIDTTAKSNCAIISRFFDAIGHKASEKENKFLLCGMIDDNTKDGNIKIDKKGKIEINKDLNDKGNTEEIFKKIIKNAGQSNVSKIIEHIFNKSILSQNGLKFKNNLENRIQYSKNGKYAYIKISDNEKEWNELGRNTEETAAIFKYFRKNLMKKNKNIEAVAVFYPTNEKNLYKMSLLTNKDYAKQIINNIRNTTLPDIVAGGHENRSGGTIYTENSKDYDNWVDLFVKSADEVLI